MPLAASVNGSVADIVRLFLAADRHLSKVDPILRDTIMRLARAVLIDLGPQYDARLRRCLLAVPPRPRAAFTNTLRRAEALTRQAQ